MEQDIFKAGVSFGGPTSLLEIKMLICHSLAGLNRPVGFALLHEALQEHDLVNYFSLVEAVDQLASSGHLVHSQGERGQDLYALSPIGEEAASEFASSLPPAVREKGAADLRRALGRKQRLSELSIRETPQGGGYLLELSIPEAEGDLLGLRVFAPTAEQRDQIKRRFLNDPAYLYKGVLALLTGDRSILEELAPPGETLF